MRTDDAMNPTTESAQSAAAEPTLFSSVTRRRFLGAAGGAVAVFALEAGTSGYWGSSATLARSV